MKKMLLSIIEKMRKYETLVFWNRCRIHRNEEDFRKLVLEGFRSSNLLEVQNYGDEYKGEMIYCINEFGRYVGFFGEFIFVLVNLFFAEERGLVPYVFWGEKFLYFEEGGIEGESNAFQYYFKPVSQVKNIQKAAFVINSTDQYIAEGQRRLNGHGYYLSDKYIELLSVMLKKYVQYNDKTQKYLEEEYCKLIGDKKAIAVHFRGSDYRQQYNNHPKFISIEEEIKTVQEVLKKNDYDVIFLATDEQMAVQKFIEEFGTKVKVYADVLRVEKGMESVAFSHSERKNHRYLLGLEVLRDQYTLARCNGLVGGITNLTTTARIMKKAWYSNDYEDMIILDHGLCQNEKFFSNAKH